jgi:hypothetical protein
MNIYKVSQDYTWGCVVYGEAWVCVAEDEESAKFSKLDHWDEISVYSDPDDENSEIVPFTDFKVEFISTYDGPLTEPHIILVSYPE